MAVTAADMEANFGLIGGKVSPLTLREIDRETLKQADRAVSKDLMDRGVRSVQDAIDLEIDQVIFPHSELTDENAIQINQAIDIAQVHAIDFVNEASR